MELKYIGKMIEIGGSLGSTVPAKYSENYHLKKGEKYRFTIETEPVNGKGDEEE